MTFKVDFSTQTTSWFKDRLAEDKLEFKPPFQRLPVWASRHKAYLIDTVLRKLPIPEVYLQKETDQHGETVWSIVDGQQRIRTLLEFSKGSVELSEKHSPGRDGDTWTDLSPTEKVDYWNYRLVVREITDATETDLRDLFERLNANTVLLSAQEIRNARFRGEFITTMTELADQEFWAENGIVSAQEIRRMKDIEFVSELFLGLMHGPQNKKTSLDPMYAAYEAAIPDKLKWSAKFEAARALTAELVPDLRSTRWRGKSDYYSLFLVAGELSATPSTAKKRASAAKALAKFGNTVTTQLSKAQSGVAKKKPSKEVRRYVEAVEKAASDKDRRQTRHEVLLTLLKPLLA